MTPHYTTLQYTTPHYTTIHHTTLHYTTPRRYTGKMKICMDCAASEFYKEDKRQYDLAFKSDTPNLMSGVFVLLVVC